MVDAAISRAVDRVSAKGRREEGRQRLEAELRAARQEVERLVAAVRAGADVPALVDALRPPMGAEWPWRPTWPRSGHRSPSRRRRRSDGARASSWTTTEIRPNNYNPNRMTDAQFKELVDELSRLGRVPKPVVVRSTPAGWIIVDGEHSWRAARELGWPDVQCEVVDVDDVEAMRQTFKRNEHGVSQAVYLGRMFKAMLNAQELSGRELAQMIGTSEGTVRNALVYERAAELRNRYAADDLVDDEIAKLTVRQVRTYVDLPSPIRDEWLDAGADLKDLARAMNVAVNTGPESRDNVNFSSLDGCSGWQALVDAGLAERVSAPDFVESAHEAFRLLHAQRRYGTSTAAIAAYVRALAVRELPSEWIHELPCRETNGGVAISISLGDWEGLLDNCMTRARTRHDLEALFRASLRVAQRRESILEIDSNDPRTIDAMNTISDAPACVREADLPFGDRLALASFWRGAKCRDQASMIVRRACQLLQAPADSADCPPSVTAALETAIADVEQETEAARDLALLNDSQRLRECVLHHLRELGDCAPDGSGAPLPVEQSVQESLSALAPSALQLLGAVILRSKHGVRHWLHHNSSVPSAATTGDHTDAAGQPNAASAVALGHCASNRAASEHRTAVRHWVS